MKVTNVRAMRLVGPDPHGIGGAPRDWSVVIVKIETDEGLYGLGEGPQIMGVREGIEAVREYLIGRDPLEIRPLVTAMLYGKVPPGGEPSMSPTATPTGPVLWGLAGVEMALCDLAGRAANTPCYNLFGGKYRERIRIYLDRSGPDAVDDLGAWRDLSQEAVSRGFSAMKFDIDCTATDCTEDIWNRAISLKQMNRVVERLGAVREAVGPDVEVAADGHMYYNTTDAIRLAQELAPLKLMWLEDLTPITSPDAMAEVRAKSSTPICVGEMFNAEQFRLFIDRKACDIIHPDVLFAGGLHETRRIADYADLHYIPLAMHNNGGALATMGAAHVAAASRNFLGLEYHFHDAPWLAQYVERGRPLFENGHVVLEDKPGLGVELNHDICRKHLAPGEEYIF